MSKVNNSVVDTKKKKKRITTVPQFNSTKKLLNQNKNILSLVTNK